MSTAVPDLRGRMYRERRLMPPQETIEFLRRQKVANVGTVDASGRPYVVPLVYIYEGGDLLYLHTGDHQGHFLTHVPDNPQICVEVSEIGDLHRGKPYACNSALVYTSVVAPGTRSPTSQKFSPGLTYLDSQCPECTQIEWPTGD